MTEFLVPEKDPTKQREWAIDVLSWRAFWITQLSGPAVLRQAAAILGETYVAATEAFIADRRPAWDHLWHEPEQRD
jgi:hypothetical protein